MARGVNIGDKINANNRIRNKDGSQGGMIITEVCDTVVKILYTKKVFRDMLERRGVEVICEERKVQMAGRGAAMGALFNMEDDEEQSEEEGVMRAAAEQDGKSEKTALRLHDDEVVGKRGKKKSKSRGHDNDEEELKGNERRGRGVQGEVKIRRGDPSPDPRVTEGA
jgi:hypothetical protein